MSRLYEAGTKLWRFEDIVENIEVSWPLEGSIAHVMGLASYHPQLKATFWLLLSTDTDLVRPGLVYQYFVKNRVLEVVCVDHQTKT
jgi:hypothetical protein